VEERVAALRREHPAWGPRKLRQYLIDREGVGEVPAASTIGAVLRRRGLVGAEAWRGHTAYQRFEYPEPNDLWQMDFKGHFATTREGACHPLCVVDDHSRYSVGVRACRDEEGRTVREELTGLFRKYGLPAGMLADNGASWRRHGATSVWLMRLGVRLVHGRPAHPQTQGKLERFNRTLKAEAIGCASFGTLGECQGRFDAWREEYNHRRPHEAVGMKAPASRYRASVRAFPEALPAIEYGPGDEVRTVLRNGILAYAGGQWPVGAGYAGLPVAVRATLVDGVKAVFFCQQKVAEIDLREENR
jgi:transposase InsO family protein